MPSILRFRLQRCIAIRIIVIVSGISSMLVILAASSVALLGKAPKKYDLQPAMLLWRVGVGEPENVNNLVEVITRGKLGSHDIWRVTHYSQTPERFDTNEYDFYDLDRESLIPIRSISRHENEKLELTFSSAAVTVRSNTAGGAERMEQLSLDGPVQPEGPGLTPWVATLPLSKDYKLDYQIVDRWSGTGNSRLKKMRLEVLSKRVIDSQFGKTESFEVVIRPLDRSFDIREDVIAAGLHWPLRMTYIRGDLHVDSEVLAIAVSAN